MKVLAVCLLALFATCVFATVSDEVAHQKWVNFLVKFDKHYENADEEMTRFKIFRDNLDRNEVLNAMEGEEVFGVTKFTDLSPEEFSQLYLMKNPTRWFPSDKSRAAEADVSGLAQSMPSSFNWVSQGATTPIYNQEQCGSCWAFSATESIESINFMVGNGLTSLSMQQIVSCDHYDDGCGGGEPMTAYYYVKGAGGLETFADYPYTAENGVCKFDKADIVETLGAWEYVTKNRNETEMMVYSYSKGPISICVDASSWSNYNGGILGAGCGTALDHCVQLVGWDTSSSGEEYWIVRNSWGADWGLDGYIYLERNHNVCGMAQEVTSPLVEKS